MCWFRQSPGRRRLVSVPNGALLVCGGRIAGGGSSGPAEQRPGRQHRQQGDEQRGQQDGGLLEVHGAERAAVSLLLSCAPALHALKSRPRWQ